MWAVVNKSSGISAYSSSDRTQCAFWLLCNNFDEDGKDLGLYILRKAFQNASERPTRPTKQSANGTVASQ